MNQPPKPKLRTVLKRVYRAHPYLLFASGFIFLSALAALGISVYYYIAPSPAPVLQFVANSLLAGHSSSSSTAAAARSNHSSSSSSSTGAHSSSSSSSSSSSILSSSSTGPAGIGGGSGGGALYAQRSSLGYYSTTTSGVNGTIKVFMPGVNRYSQIDYGFVFFNNLYQGYANSFRFYSNQTTFQISTSYNNYVTTVPSITVILNSPQQHVSLGFFTLNYQMLPIFNGTMDINGRCGVVSVTAQQGLLNLTSLGASFIYPNKVYCVQILSPYNTIPWVPASLNNNGFAGSYDASACAFSANGQLFLRFVSSASATSLITVGFDFTKPAQTTAPCALGYCELVGSPCPANAYCSSVNATTYTCVCNKGWTGPTCSDSTVLTMTFINTNLAPINTSNGLYYVSTNPVSLTSSLVNSTGPAQCYFFSRVPAAQNEFCMELNTASNPYQQPESTLLALVTDTLTGATSISGFSNYYGSFNSTQQYYPVLSFQREVASNYFYQIIDSNSYCQFYSPYAILVYQHLFSGTMIIAQQYYAQILQLQVPSTASMLKYFYFPFVADPSYISYNFKLALVSDGSPFANTTYCVNSTTTASGLYYCNFVPGAVAKGDQLVLYVLTPSPFTLIQDDPFIVQPWFNTHLAYDTTAYYCELHPGTCRGNSSCISLSSTAYNCRCAPGYFGTNCTDTMCSLNPTICQFNGACLLQTTPPFYYCKNVFLTQWITSNSGTSNSSQVQLPLVSTGSYNFTVLWGDGTSNLITTYNQPTRLHTYGSAGVYTIAISGLITGFDFQGAGDNTKLTVIANFGSLALLNPVSSNGIFQDCNSLTITALDNPNLAQLTSMAYMFQNTFALTTIPTVNTWNTSTVTLMSGLFYGSSFRSDISSWDVSNVRKMDYMFYNTAFNLPLGTWNTSQLQDASLMFGSGHFNQPIGSWNTQSLTSLSGTFQSAHNFNQNISSWNTSSVLDMSNTFNGGVFNQDISKWDVSHVKTMSHMFQQSVFNKSLATWNTARVTDMSFMFTNNFYFQQDLSNWITSNVTTMDSMFWGAIFNGNVSRWDIRQVTNLHFFLQGDTHFTTANYDSLLIGWSNEPGIHNLTQLDTSSYYSCAPSPAATARAYLMTHYSWTINDFGCV